ncbi:MAG TPA: hydantoinase B/oxoprolinase family protein [Chloroflexota bacterium]|nr:hydantoinase B/oxoprolinase family protein [Chloroflexota bacterium]
MPAVKTAVDPITVEVIRHKIGAMCDEMEVNLMRTAFSPTVYESRDFCAALLDPEGQVIGQALGGNAIFLCDLTYAIADVYKVYGRDGIEPDDIFASNDPNVFGQHLNNVVLILPVFFEGRLVAFSAVRSHWVDIGGRDPGGWNVDTTEIYQEGLQIPTVKLFKRGRMDDELARLIGLNVRDTDEVFGDLHAQVVGCQLGARRFTEMLARYGEDTVFESIRIIWDQSETRVRQVIESIPDGSYTAKAVLDDDGLRRNVPVPLKITVRIDGSELTVDYSDMPPQTPGPLNTRPPAAMSAARITVKMFSTPFEFANEGAFRPVHVIVPEGTMFNAGPGAPVAQWSPPLTTVVDMMLAALSSAMPDRLPAGSRNDIGGIKVYSPPGAKRPWRYTDALSGGWGAMPFRDGACGLKTVRHGDSKILSAEMVESRAPVIIESEGLIPDSGGAGKFRGGLGTGRTFRVLEDGIGAFSMHRSDCPPWGMYGGEPGRPDMFHFRIPGREPFSSPKIDNVPLPAGSVVRMETAGGGGWGSPFERDPALVALDVYRGYVSREMALEKYGVALDEDGNVDQERTKEKRHA